MKEIKQTIIDGILEQINGSPFLLVADYSGMTVPQFAELRNKLTEVGARFQVAKNTFVKRAAETAELPDEVAEHLVGQTAVVTGECDVCGAAKVIKDFQKENKLPAMRCGVLDGEFLDEAKVTVLASLPSKEVLQAMFLGLLNKPAQQLVTVLDQPGASLARVLQAKADQG